jgi:hypothetical protein
VHGRRRICIYSGARSRSVLTRRSLLSVDVLGVMKQPDSRRVAFQFVSSIRGATSDTTQDEAVFLLRCIVLILMFLMTRSLDMHRNQSHRAQSSDDNCSRRFTVDFEVQEVSRLWSAEVAAYSDDTSDAGAADVLSNAFSAAVPLGSPNTDMQFAHAGTHTI